MSSRSSRSYAVSLGVVASALAVTVAVAVGAAPPDAPPTALPRLPQEGGLAFDVRDARTGAPIPCKLTLVGVDGSRDP